MIIYTKTDEAPALATASLFPILDKFLSIAGIKITQKNISLAARTLAAASIYLPDEQKVSDDLKYLADLCLQPDANIIKLPNISASVSQLKAAITELREKGFAIPEYPDVVKTDEDETVRKMYSVVLGSAVNPVIREGNSDRRAAKAVKNFAKKNPHKMGAWDKNSKTRVASMTDGDFYGSEKSITAERDMTVRFVLKNNNTKELREPLKILKGEILDTAVMSEKLLAKFIENCMAQAKADGVLFSFHLKATMMKVSDPIIFGVILKTFFKSVFDKYGKVFEDCGAAANFGLADLLEKIKGNPAEEEILAEIDKCFDEIAVAMVNSEKNISNFSVPSDTIIDASMPAMIKAGGKMWDKSGAPKDTLAIIPDRAYAGIYEAVVEFCKENGAFDPRTIGSVSNVGLMAKQAEEYGSHNKTFLIEEDGVVLIIDEAGEVLMEQVVEKGDIFRACQAKHDAIVNWVQLSVERARITDTPVIFWLDEARAHDREIIKKLNTELTNLDTKGLEIKTLSPKDACIYSCKRMAAGLDTISATGNVLRDYLTDLFPIIELGTSAKMLSIVPLMAGGGLFETGAGGSAPKHIQQFIAEDYLRWDSLGEFMAIVPSLEKYAQTEDSPQAKILAETLDEAIENILENQKSPNRAPVSLDNRGSHFYLAMYWAKAIAKQTKDNTLANKFSELANKLAANEGKIVAELLAVQGKQVDLGGYYLPDTKKAEAAMRPSKIFNEIIENNN